MLTFENNEVVARLNFLRDLAVGCYEGDNIHKWNDLPQDEKELYLEEVKQRADYILTLEEIKMIEKLTIK